MIKPILIPTDKMSEIGSIGGSALLLIDTTKEEKIVEGVPRIDFFNISLIDTEARIVEGDWYLNLISKDIVKVDFKIDYEQNHCAKIISLTNKLPLEPYQGHFNGIDCTNYLPQLSEQAIQLLINYYNKHKCMPESVDVKEESIYPTCGKRSETVTGLCSVCEVKTYKRLHLRKYGHQQGEVDITIPEVEDKLRYCKAPSKVLPCSHYYKDGRCLHPSHCNFKAKEKLYTESEVSDFVFQAYNLRTSDGKVRSTNSLIDWFNSKKK